MKPKLADEYLQVDQMEWEDFAEDFQTGGVQWKLLHVSPEIGSWTVVFRCPAGSTFAPHVHHGPGEGYVFKGEIEVRGGERMGGTTGPRERIYLRGRWRDTRSHDDDTGDGIHVAVGRSDRLETGGRHAAPARMGGSATAMGRTKS